MKAVLTEHNCASFTSAPVGDGSIDQIFATFSAVTLYARFVWVKEKLTEKNALSATVLAQLEEAISDSNVEDPLFSAAYDILKSESIPVVSSVGRHEQTSKEMRVR